MGFVWQSQRNDHLHLRPVPIISLHDTIKQERNFACQNSCSGVLEGVSLGHSWSALTVRFLSPVRRTTAVIVGTAGLLEIEGDKILLTERPGGSADCSVTDILDDSYHAPWFMAAAADYERVLNQGPHADLAQVNLHEAATALTLTLAAQRSATQDGRAAPLNIPEQLE